MSKRLTELERLHALYDCCKNRYRYTIGQIRLTKEELGRGCTSHMHMIGDEEGRLRGVQIEKSNLRDLKFCARVESAELREIKYKIKAEQRKIAQGIAQVK